MGSSSAMLTSNKLVVTFYLCANFGENRSRNETVRVYTNGQIQTSYIICPMLYATAMGHIIIKTQKN